MKLEALTQATGEWLKGTGPESDIVMSSRVRLARNLAQFPFVGRASEQDREEIERLLQERIASRRWGRISNTSTWAGSRRSTGCSSSSGS